ncbi:MAG: carboxypeptidase-like regulatory domain-containing protein, partial [Saprospiraceae bacterium]|nr:carboxypeptidase-like regulatory domain-containing protein [Saprospiraceae bacterium]
MKQKTLGMNPLVLRISFLSLFLALGTFLSAQIQGKVTDAETGEPLIGASVLVQGTSSGTVTDLDGNFSVAAKPGDLLEVSYTGYSTQELEVGSQSVIDIQLSVGVALGEVIVTGYSVESKRQTTGAVSIVKSADLKAIPSGNVEQQLQGRVAGVTVVTNGQPGTTSQI